MGAAPILCVAAAAALYRQHGKAFSLEQGKIVPYSDARVGVLTHALNYGTAVFGGMRGYWSKEEEQLFVFRQAHAG